MQNNNDFQFFGVHVFGEMYGIEASILNDPKTLESALAEGIKQSGATLVGNMQIKQFSPYGVTLLALLEESHASIHTYPEVGALFFDAFTCGDHCFPNKIAEHLMATLKPERHNLNTLERGKK